MGCTLRSNNKKSSRWRNWRRRERRGLVETGARNESVQGDSVQYKGYNLIGVTTVERGDGSYDSTGLFQNMYTRLYRVYVQVY
jgi:hypothetical protein